MPGKERTSAIGVSADLYVAQVGHPPNLSQPSEHVGGNPIIDGENHHRITARRVPTDLHARDVHVVLAEDAANSPHDARAVLVAADQEAALGHEVDPKRVDAHSTRLPHQDGAGYVMTLHPHRDEARVAALGAASPLDQLDPPAARDEAGVDRIYSLLRERLQKTFDWGCDHEIH